MTPQLGRIAAGRPARSPAAPPAVLTLLVTLAAVTSLLGCSAGSDDIGAAGPAQFGISAPGTPDAPDDSLSPPGSAPAREPAAAPVQSASPTASPTVIVKAAGAKDARATVSSRAATARGSASRRSVATPSPAAARGGALAQEKTAASPSPNVTSSGLLLLLGPATESAAETEVVRLVNVQRTAAGCAAVTADATLVQLARAHSLDMSGAAGFRHNGSDGRTPFQRMMAAGYEYSVAAENIAAGQGTASAVMAAWMSSPGHQANIVDCRFTGIGVGMVSRPGTPYVVYWTQEFGTPM
jgi:uncharacterized protein YkwD